MLYALLRLEPKQLKTGVFFEDFVNTEAWESNAIKIADSMEALIGSVFTTLSAIELKKATLWMAAAIATAGMIYEGSQLLNTPEPTLVEVSPVGKINLPAAEVGAPPPDEECDGTEKKNSESVCQYQFHFDPND